MLALISKKFAVSIRPKSSGTDNRIQIYARQHIAKKTLDLGVFRNIRMEDAICQLEIKLQDIIKSDEGSEADILTILKKTWWQYSDNIYFIHTSIAEDKKQTAFLLAILEFYVQRFSLEMTCFLDSLSLSDKEIIHTAISDKIDSNDNYYSELLAAKYFSRINTQIRKRKEEP